MAADARRVDRLAGVGVFQWAAVLLAVVTGALHVYVGAVDARIPLVLAGLGFPRGVGMFFAGYRGRRLYLLAIAYTAFQVVAWTVVNAGAYTAVGYADKAVQLALITVLAILACRH